MTNAPPRDPVPGVTDALPVVLDAAVGAAVGIAAGLLFFSGLWWTVQRLPSSRNPALLVLLSFVLRTALVLGAFAGLVFAYDSSTPLLTGVAAFLIVRILVVRRLGRPAARDAATSRPDPDGGR
jgi:F1F0 ATPase subunit 2